MQHSVKPQQEQHSYTTMQVIRLGLEPKTPALKVLCSTD